MTSLRLLMCFAAGVTIHGKFTPTKSEGRPLPDPVQFKQQAIPLVQSFIFSNYDKFAASQASAMPPSIAPRHGTPFLCHS